MQRFRIVVLSLALVIAGKTPLLAQDDKAKPSPKKTPTVTQLPQLPSDLHDALQNRDHKLAVAIIDRELKKPKAPADYLLYLKGRSLTELKAYASATKVFLSLERRFPKSRWVARARFGRADIHVRERDYRKAGAIYKAEAERLLSDKRQDQLTGIYLEFADRYFEGVKPNEPGAERKPDYKQAYTYYIQALKLRSGKPKRRKIEFRIARCLQEMNQHGPAIAAYQAFLEKYASKETKDENRVEVKLEAAARFELGRTQLAAGQYVAARKTWQDFLTSDAAKKAGGDFIARTQYQLARTHGVPKPHSIASLELGVALAEQFVKQFPKHKLAPQAEFDIAQSYLHYGRYEQAVAKLKSLIANPQYAKAKQVADARRLLGDVYLVQKKFKESIAAYRSFLDEHPTDSNWAAVQRRVIDAEFVAAAEQQRQKNYAAARKAWQTFLNKYPLDARASKILLAFGAMNYAAAVEKHNDDTKQAPKADGPRPIGPAAQKLFNAAISDWRRLVSKYPKSNEASHAAYMVGVTLEDRLAKLAVALEAYKKVTGAYSSVATKRIAALTAKKLDILTERKFGSDEKPVIKIRTRNLEKVTVKVYRIDMVDYFRKMHLAGGVETLDIALIDPDKSWEYKVAGYEKYRQLINDIEIPTKGPGVTAVTVSSEKLEATTMVIVSDIDLIVKASRNELFVFAQNRKTQKPVEGVSLLISDGKEVFAEEVTGKDGILQKSFEKLKSVKDLRVFGIHEGHAASTVSNLEGLNYAVGLAAKGYLYTDRPAYRAGELVHLKGVIRWVNNDTYTFKAGEKYKLNVYDARGRAIHTKEIALGKFGAFSDRLQLPATAPQGQYRVHLHQPGKSQSYETIFSVHEIKLEPIQLTVDLPRKVYYRGEKIEGTLTLKYYYGTPLANRTLRYQISGGPSQTATTDAKGQIKFKFETTQHNESAQLQIAAQYPERNITTRTAVFIATRGFAVGVKTRRRVYIAGETFDATATVIDPAGKPVATDLKIEVLQLLQSRRVAPRRTRGEKLFASHQVKSDETKGTATQTLRIDKPGYYKIRATGKDRFGNTVSGEHLVRISGDDDKIRLRILAEKHNYKVGDNAKVQLHWREAPALALVTFEGAKVLGYRLVELKKGANALSLPMAAKLAPNFVLSVAVMHKNKFHQAQSEFLVARKLNIKLTSRRAQPAGFARPKARGPRPAGLAPGDQLTVEVVTTDPQGKPVAAEIALGLIQRNLLDRFEEHQGAIAAYFGGGYRQPSVRAFTSATFHYRPKTRGISKYLLAEKERRAILEKELEVRKMLAQFEKARVARIQGVDLQAIRESRKRLSGGKFEEAEEVARKAIDLQVILNEGLPGTDIAGQTLPSAYYMRDDVQFFTTGPTTGNGGSSGYIAAYNKLFKQRRYAEAEAIAKQMRRNHPDNSTVETMYWKARFARRVAASSNSNRREVKENGFWNQLNEVEDGTIDPGDSKFPAKWKQTSQNGQGVVQPGSVNGERRVFNFYVGVDRSKFAADKTRQLLWNKTRFEGKTSNNQQLQSLIIRPNPSVENNQLLQNLSNLTDGTIVALNEDNGEYQVVNGLSVAKLKGLAKQGLRVLPGMAAAETGYWNPAVVTGKDGKAVVKFRLPNRSTAWKLRAKGTDAGVLTGQAETELVTRKDLFGQLKTPLAFTQGDKANVLVEVHNAKLKTGAKINVTLETKIGNRSTKLAKTITSNGPGISELSFPVEITKGDSVEFKLTVGQAVPDGRKKKVAEAPRQAKPDLQTATVPIRPFGLPVFAAASGSAAQNTIVFVKHDKSLDVQNQNLELIIGPSINRTLLDAVLGGGMTRCESRLVLSGSGIERSVSDILGGVALLKMIRASRNADSPEGQAVSGRIQSTVVSLVSSQHNDGGWSWAARPTGRAPSDRFLSSRVVWALAVARKAGFAVPEETFDKARQYLKSQFTASATSDREGQAILLHGMATAGCADFAFANRLYRERNNLSASALLHVALSLVELDRKEMAKDLLALVKIPSERKRVARIGNPGYLKGVPHWMRNGVELRALYLLALNAAKPTDANAGKLADWLLAARRGSRWYPEKSNGPAIAALAEWFAKTKFAAEKYTLQVVVNGGLVEKFTLDPAKDGSRRVIVPAKLLDKAKGKPQQINIAMTGRGRFSYSAVLSGFVAADKLKSTTNQFTVSRTYQPAQRMLDGRVIPRGFGILAGEYKTFTNPLTQLPVGDRGEVALRIRRPNQEAHRDYLVVTEPIPAGCSVLEGSITGRFQRYEITPGAITFYIGSDGYSQDIAYTLIGYLPGDYKAIPTIARSFYAPSRIAISTIKPLRTLARGEKSKDAYRLSPVELYEFGKRHLAKRDYKIADAHLTRLFRNHKLRANIYQDVVRKLFQTSFELKRNRAIVEFFEIIKEKYPAVEIEFDDILAVANAYRTLGEYERGYLVYRATIEAAFERESQIAGFLDDRGEFLRSVQIVENLLANYPAESYIATGTYSLAQEVFGKAGEVIRNKKLRDAGLTKAGLIAANVRMLDHFLSTWPADPAVDQAAFAMANSYLELENFAGAIRRCEKFAKRYPKSKLLDSFWYVIGYSKFAAGKHGEALKMVQKVAETKRKDPASGIKVDAANKWQAVYIMGQIYHSLGEPKKAIAEYKRVSKRFPDASQSIDFFTRKEITLPELTTVKPGKAVKAELKFRNIASVNVKVYRIDLLKFGLMQRNLNRITAINLAGIRPYHEMTLKLGDGNDYRDRKQDLQLPLKKEGAYLVVCRGSSLYASGLVLVSPLTLQVQEKTDGGRVRVTVRDVTADAYAKDVEVKVIGSGNKQFTSGKSDLRGIFIADAIRGTSTVIAKADKNRYAFFRGKTQLGGYKKQKPGISANQKNGSKSGKRSLQGGKKGDLLKNLRQQNYEFNGKQRLQYKNMLRNKRKGVEAKKAY